MKYRGIFLLFFLYNGFLQGQAELGQIAAAAANQLADRNYGAALNSYNVALKNNFFANNQKLSKREKNDQQKIYANFQYSSAVALANLGEYAKGLTQLNELIAAYPTFSLANFYRAAYQQQFFDYAIDLKVLEKGYKDFGDFNKVTAIYAKTCYDRGLYAAALDAFQKVLKKDKSPDNYYWVGKAQQLLGKEKEAKKTFKKGLAAFPTAASAANRTYEDFFPQMHFELGQTDKALELAKRLLAENADNYRAQQAYAYLLYQSKNYEQSIEAFQKVINDDPFADKAFIYLAKSYYGANKLAEAIATLDNLTKEFPNYAAAYAARAEIYFQEQQLEKAKAAIEIAVGLLPSNAAFLDLQKQIEKSE